MEDSKRKRVTLEGGFPWGFRMSGGTDTTSPLTIARVNSGSKAALQGIVEGDIILAINGKTADRLTNKEAHDLVKSAASVLHLELSQLQKNSSTSVPKMPNSSSNENRHNQQNSGSETQSAQSDSNQSPSKTSAVPAGSPSLKTTYRCNSFKPGTWSPGLTRKAEKDPISKKEEQDPGPPPPPVWTPSLRRSSSTERKEFRPVRLETSSFRRQASVERDKTASQTPTTPSKDLPESPKLTRNPPVSTNSSAPYSVIKSSSTNTFPGSGLQRRPPTVSYKSSASSVSTPVATPTSHLPKVPNPTVTLLQKAREGQLPKGAAYLESQPVETNTLNRSPAADTSDNKTTEKTNGSSIRKETNGFATLPKSATSTAGATRNNSDEGIPLAIYPSEKDANYHHWYRRMYDSLHRTRNPQDDFITVRYKANKVRGGYLSEPEPFDYDSDYGRLSTLDRRRDGSIKDSDSEATLSRSLYDPEHHKNQPGRIEDYEPGRSSIVEQEKKKVQKQINIPPKSFTAFALKEGGYESDSQLVFRRKSEAETPSDPGEQRAFYRDIQRGGEVPLHGLRKPIPEKIQGPVHRFKESQVTIHYKSPIRKLQSPTGDRDIDEEELRQIQAEHMRQVYEQERRRKILQEIEDIESRRHMDNLLPSQKSPIPLNRYDDFVEDKPRPQRRDYTPEPKTVARALYNFVALNSRELPFHKGDIIFVRRQIDKNWFEGEHNAMIGIFPANYVEIIPYDNIRSIPKNPAEGQARVKYNFTAQAPMELSLIKGELVILTRKIDDHWLEGHIGHRKGIFPASYVDVMRWPSEKPSVAKPLAHVMTHSLMTNGSLRVNNHRNAPYVQQTQPRNQYSSLPILGVSRSGNNLKHAGATSTSRPAQPSLQLDTHADSVPYRVLYPYVPQNQDELELQEGDTVYVLEKCDDGWYVGTCQRTGRFGTFPGNYVDRL